MNKKVLLFVVPLFFMSGVLLGTFYFSGKKQEQKEELQTAFAFPVKKALSDFTFKDQHGNDFTRKSFNGKWSLVFFGFTHCPDICPTTLSTLSKAYSALPSEVQERVQVVLVSVDPERDSVSKLSEYIGFFNPNFTALATNREDLIKLTQSLGVSFIKRPLTGGSDYTIDHSSRLFLIDPSARRAAMFSPQQKYGLSGFSDIEIRDDLLALVTKSGSKTFVTRQ